jgi:hypothetical protein
MLKRRLTLIFKVDNSLRLHLPGACGLRDKIMRYFNILPRIPRRNRISLSFAAPGNFLVDEFEWMKMAEVPQSLTIS